MGFLPLKLTELFTELGEFGAELASFSFVRAAPDGCNKGGRKQMRANPPKCRQMLTNVSK